MRSISIYIHIPYCLRKCFYCDFNSVNTPGEKDIRVYVDAVKKDIIFSGGVSKYSVKTVYFGGGTPSILSGTYIHDIIELLKSNFNIGSKAEITIEANPATLTPNLLLMYKKTGINRISLGVQSFQDSFLKQLGRVHNSEQAKETIALLRKSGFDNVSIDLMCGLPGQTIRQWQDDLNTFLSLDLEHVSFYDLTIEPGTLFWDKKDELNLPDEDTVGQMYTLGCQMLEDRGYKHYEISSFAKPQKESRHTCSYWKNEEYIGIGAGAFSYLDGSRFSKPRDIAEYVTELYSGEVSYRDIEKLNSRGKLAETLVLNLRMMEGVEIVSKFPSEIIRLLDDLIEQRLLERKSNRYKLTEKGILLYDTVASTLVGE